MLKRLELLEEQVSTLTAKSEAAELEALRREADSQAAAPAAEQSTEERTFISGDRALQMLNPELSVSGDFLAGLVLRKGFYAGEEDRSGLPLRALDVHLQSQLDPFSFTKIALDISPTEGLELEETYITWTGVVPKLSITVGKFRQLFGVLNRWHPHDLDQTDYPLALTEILGEDGLAQSGVSLKWLMPSLLAHTNELTLEVTNGSNSALFAGEYFSVPSALAHLKNYYDLNEDTYLEFGLSGTYGFNNKRGYTLETAPNQLLDEPWRSTLVAGADLTLHWSPLNRARYRSLTWRSEALWLRKEQPLGIEHGWGAYSYLQYQLNSSWFIGLRGDLVQPPSLGERSTIWQAVPYVTYWQSEFVYMRLEARHGDGFPYGQDSRVLFQINWAAGPHKHEKY